MCLSSALLCGNSLSPRDAAGERLAAVRDARVVLDVVGSGHLVDHGGVVAVEYLVPEIRDHLFVVRERRRHCRRKRRDSRQPRDKAHPEQHRRDFLYV